MSEGRHAADEVRGFFKGIGKVGEEARTNVNSFADELVGGNKTHKSTGFSKDAQALAHEADKGLSSNAASTEGTTTASATGTTATTATTSSRTVQ